MNKSHSFSFIIGYRHSPDRLNTLKRVIDWLVGFGGVQIIIVEQDIHSKLDTLTLKGIKHIFTKSNMPYNRSWAFNVGLKYANTDVIVFGDSDIIVEPQDLINSLRLIEKYDCVSPYNVVLDLTQQESGFSIEDIKRIQRPGRGEIDNQKINLCEGIVIYKKEAIYKIGGWCEDFIGLGGEGGYQEHKTKNLLTHYESTGKCYHLWHHRVESDKKWYPRNLELLNKLVSLQGQELIKQINMSSPKIGLKNKYS